MLKLNFTLLYVAAPARSAEFYAKLLGRKPVESSPGFAMFVLDNGFKLGLWKRNEVQPEVQGAAGTAELVFAAESDTEVDDTFADWTAKGIVVAQTPFRLQFGYTFVGFDPDGHRLRVYKLADNPR